MPIKLLDLILSLYVLFYLSLFFTDYSGLFSNTLGFTIGLVLFIAIRFAYRGTRLSEFFLVRLSRWLIKQSDKRLLLLSISLLFLVLSAVSLARHYSFSSGSYDLGIFCQSLWNTLRGDFLFSSLKGNICLLGDHFEPALVLFALPYRLWPSPNTLLLAQAFLLASCIIPIYLVAKNFLNERYLIFAFVVSFMLSKPLRGIAYSDFHLEALVLPLFFWLYYFLIKRKNILFWLCALLLFSCKEDVAILLAAFGAYIFFFQKRRYLGASLFFISIFAWTLQTQVIIPHYNPFKIYPYTSKLSFGSTFRENIAALARNPALLISKKNLAGQIGYVIKSIGPTGFLPLFSLQHYILLIVGFLRNLLLAKQACYYDISSHYTANVLPFIYISSIYAAARICEKFPKRRIGWAVAVLLVISSLVFYGKSDAHRFAKFLKNAKKMHAQERLAALGVIPLEASVAANFCLVPHLSNRKYIFDFSPEDKKSLEVDYVVIDFDLLEYLTVDKRVMIPGYLKAAQERGYRLHYRGFGNRLLILKKIHSAEFL